MAGTDKMVDAAGRKNGFFLTRWIRDLTNWVLHWADTPYAAPMLGVLSFAESSFFPIPPDVLMIPMAASRQDRAIRFGMITWTTSVLGGMFGYLIGFLFFDTIGIRIIEAYGLMHKYFEFRQVYNEWGLAIIMIAGLSPLPYKVFTITAGVAVINFPVFVLGSVLSRSIRFMAEAYVCKYGDFFSEKIFKMPIKDALNKYINLFATSMAVLGVGGFLVVKVVLSGHGVDIERQLTLPGTSQPAAVHFRGMEDKMDPDKLSYHLSLTVNGSSVATEIPEGPFLESGHDGATIHEVLTEGGELILAAVLYADLPKPDNGTDGIAAIYMIKRNKPVHLTNFKFEKYRLGANGAWDEGNLKVTGSNNNDSDFKVSVETIHHAGRASGEDNTSVQEHLYRLEGNMLFAVE